MLPTLEQVLEYSRTDLEAPKPPTPYEIALSLTAALLATGKFGDDAGAAVVTAWKLVPTFYAGRRDYEEHMRMLAEIAQQARPTGPSFQVTRRPAASPVEGAAGEAPGEVGAEPGREYVTGETGDAGETRTQPAPPAASGYVILTEEQQRERQERIVAAQQRVAKAAVAKDQAAGALARFKGKGKAARLALEDALARAESEWKNATAEQSAAYL